MKNNNAYMKKYMLDRYHRRMAEFKKILGGKCICCGSSNDLEIDHKDIATKSFTIARKAAGAPMNVLLEELKKCQLLCVPCHTKKTLADLGQVSARDTHGTISSYRYCKCDLCKKAKSDCSKEYKKRKRAQPDAPC